MIMVKLVIGMMSIIQLDLHKSSHPTLKLQYSTLQILNLFMPKGLQVQ